jgi:hypothetical protein
MKISWLLTQLCLNEKEESIYMLILIVRLYFFSGNSPSHAKKLSLHMSLNWMQKNGRVFAHSSSSLYGLLQ